MSLWKKVSLGVLIVLALLLDTVEFLAGTTTGLHLVFRAADRWVSGLDIDKVTGGQRDLTLDNIRYEQPGMAITAGQFHLSIKLCCLWGNGLYVNDIALYDIYIAVDTKRMPPAAPVEEEDNGPLNLSTLYPITLSRVALYNVNIKVDDVAVSVRDFSTGLNWREKNLTLAPTSLQGLLIALSKMAKVTQEQVVEPKIDSPKPQEKPLGKTVTDLFSQPVLPAMADVHPPLNLNIQAFREERLRLTDDTDIIVCNLLLKASSIDSQMRLDALDIDSGQDKINASGHAQLQDNWPVDITLAGTLNVGPMKGERMQLKVDSEVCKTLKVGVDLSGPVTATLRADAQLAKAGLPLGMELKSGQLAQPFSGEKQFQTDDVQLKFSGKMTNYALAFSTTVKGQSLPPARITLSAKGNERQINFDRLTVNALGGKTELKALLDWQQAISWRGELTLDGINTAKEVSDWLSRLNGMIKTQGSLYDGSWQMSMPELKITDNVKQNKVDISGSLQGNSYLQWKIPGLCLTSGPNSADIKDELGVKSLNLDATIDAPHLDSALPGPGGAAKGLMKVRGTVNAPQLPADIIARALRWQKLTTAQVSVEGNVKSTDQIGGNLDVRVDYISQPEVNISLV